MDELERITLDEQEQMLLALMAEETDPDKLETLSKAIKNLHEADTEERTKYEMISIEQQKADNDKRRNWFTIGAALVTGVLGALGIIGSQVVKGEMDSRYQDEGYAHEKEDEVIWNKRRHQR